MKKIRKDTVMAVITTGLGIIVFALTIFNWDKLPPHQRCSGIMFFVVSMHVWEEMKFPGGFTDMVIEHIGMPIRDMELPEVLLQLLIIYLGFIPYLLNSVSWLSAAPIILGTIEVVAHLASAKWNKHGKFYSPGMVTALLIMLPVTVYGYYILIGTHTVSSIQWIYALLYLLIPLILLQRGIVSSTGMKYTDFVKNAVHGLFGKENK